MILMAQADSGLSVDQDVLAKPVSRPLKLGGCGRARPFVSIPMLTCLPQQAKHPREASQNLLFRFPLVLPCLKSITRETITPKPMNIGIGRET
jgi:hypothetical protein